MTAAHYSFPAPDLARRSAPNIHECRNPGRVVGNGSGDEQPAGLLAEIAPPSSGHHISAHMTQGARSLAPGGPCECAAGSSWPGALLARSILA
jgi:hypothetical protein